MQKIDVEIVTRTIYTKQILKEENITMTIIVEDDIGKERQTWYSLSHFVSIDRICYE